ncbi:enoyl-CoA hydratase/isomerase [Roseibium album]|uniref:enoyl-CoA hydratase/isomerase n=1 Tax=Roseibium album TaxID=311410 RepID=UPI003298EE09
MAYDTLTVTFQQNICRICLNRPEAGNAINARMVEEMSEVLTRCTEEQGPASEPVTVVVLEGQGDVFCAGGDFEAISNTGSAGDPEPLYDVWSKLSRGPYVSICLVRGRVNAGGVGFVAASDVVIADKSASFALSELLFGLFPACVLPFLISRVGRQAAHYMTLMTKPVDAQKAREVGLVDVLTDNTEAALRQHLVRLSHLQKPAIARYKTYLAACGGNPEEDKAAALVANRDMFSDPGVLAGIRRYVSELKFPWER